jgi:hypothetical protein
LLQQHCRCCDVSVWYWIIMGHEVVQLVEALCYKLEGRQFEPR